MSTIIPMNSRNVYPTFMSDFDGVFNDIFRSSIFNPDFSKRRLKLSRSTTPMANVSETDSGYEIDLAAPGLSRESFQITVENNTLTVAGNDESQKNESKYSEFNYKSFSRSWTLPKEVNSEQISANYEAGILSIAIPTQKKKNHKVNIDIC